MSWTDDLRLQQNWMQLQGPTNSCLLVHTNSTCSLEIMSKCGAVLKDSSKMYTSLYLALLVLKIPKLRKNGNVGQFLRKWGMDLIGSLAFMCFMVGGMKTGLCISSQLNVPIDGKITVLLSGLGTPSMFFNEKFKRQQIIFFTVVRAIRSAYIFFKKRHKFPIENETHLCFIGIMATVSYLFFEGGPTIKYRKLVENLWGDF